MLQNLHKKCVLFFIPCYDFTAVCDQELHCSDGSDEFACSCGKDQFQCQCYSNVPTTCATRGVFKGCIPNNLVNNGIEDCPDGSDEKQEYIKIVQCGNCNVTMRRLPNISFCNEIDFPLCDNSTCYEVPSISCLDRPNNCSQTDFFSCVVSNRLKVSNCSKTDVLCTSYCDGATSYDCKQSFQCSDGSLISTSQFCDGKIDCPDNSDEIKLSVGFKCTSSLQSCVLPEINLYDSIRHCKDGSDLCTLNHSCFECFDKSFVIPVNQVCDGFFNCLDTSDELLCEVNFKSLNSVSSNLTELDFPIYNFSSINIGDSTRFTIPDWLSNYFSCYESSVTTCTVPLLQRLLYALNHTDETLFYSRCHTKHGIVVASECDGRPECSDYSDECISCSDRPRYCEDSCSHYFMMGDRYCDGVEDDAWMFINNSACPRGFDEQNCRRRFSCQAGNKISIDIAQLCDKVKDCNDGSDESENFCFYKSFSRDPLFSSDKEMIASKVFRSAFWIIGFLVIAGNTYVIISSFVKTSCFKQTPSSASLHCNQIVIFNIAVADFIMGIYLIIISVYSAIYSGRYKKVDFEWRTSLRCSLIGSLAVISSQASCLLMVTLTSFRLFHIIQPFPSLTASSLPWKLCIFISWLTAVLLAVIPILESTSEYFVHHIWMDNVFSTSGIWSKLSFKEFVVRLFLFDVISAFQSFLHGSFDIYEINNLTSRIPKITSLKTALVHMNRSFPSYLPQGQFGYYGNTSICMPRLFVAYGDTAWEYTLAILSLNFALFFYIAVCYIFICKRTSGKRSVGASTAAARARVKNREARMQVRIARIIATDFACWIPICIIAFAKIGGLYVGDIMYEITAVFLLPINSLLNPILYTLPPGKLLKKLRCPPRN